MSAVSMATSWWASWPTRWASSADASPQSAATSTAAAASQASPRAIVNARALSGRVTRPAPSAQLRQALFAERNASSLNFASLTCAARTASSKSLATPYAISLWCGNFGISVIGVSPFTTLQRRNADDGNEPAPLSEPGSCLTSSKRQCQRAALARACLATDLETGLIRRHADLDVNLDLDSDSDPALDLHPTSL